MDKSIRDKVEKGDIPKHIAIIMDGNGRWAKKKRLPRISGHKQGINSVREITRVCGEIGIKYLTLYTFSTENWNRPQREVNALMGLLLNTINIEVQELNKNNVCLKTIGNVDQLPLKTKKGIEDGKELTKNNTGLKLCLALSYGSRQEIISGVKKISEKVKNGIMGIEQIDENSFSNELYTSEFPDPDLLIRTSGENRISNFLLWQIAYSEIYLTDTYWPDFREGELIKSLFDYQSRERRFGKVPD